MGTQIHAVLGVKNRTHQYIMQTKPGLQLSCMHFVSPIPICMVARFLSLLPTPPLSLSKHIQIHVHESRTPHFDFYFTEFDFTLALAELATDRRVVFTALSLSLSLFTLFLSPRFNSRFQEHAFTSWAHGFCLGLSMRTMRFVDLNKVRWNLVSLFPLFLW